MRNFIRKAALAAAVLFFGSSASFAACTGQFQPGQLCANPLSSRAEPIGTTNPVIGNLATSGSIGLVSTAGGTATLLPPAVAGATSFQLPTLGGTIPSSATSPITLSGAGAIGCATCVTGAGGALVINSTPISGASAGQVLYSDSTKLQAYNITGSAGSVVLSTSPTISGLTVTGSFTATGLVTNADLVNTSTTVNGQTCTLGSTCTITAAATSITVGSTTVASGVTTRILYDNAGVLGEYTLTGTGTVVAMQTSPSLITPALGVATATSLAIGGATIGTDALGVTGTATISGTVTGGAFIPTSSSAPSDGMYLNSAGQTAFAAGGVRIFFFNSTGLLMANASGATLSSSAATATVPTLIPRRSDSGTGIGSSGTGSISLIATSIEQLRINNGSIYVGGAASGTNTAAVAPTISAALSTGTATNPDLVLQTGVATVSGTGQATATTGLTIKGETQALIATANLTIKSGTAIPAGGTAGAGYQFSSTSNFGSFFGSGVPTLSAAQGSIYLRSDGTPYYNTNGTTGWAVIGGSSVAITSLTGDVTGTGPGATATTVAKIQGTVVSGTTGSTNVVFSTSPTLVTPALGAATGTTLALGGCSIGVNAFCVTGSASISSTLNVSTVTIASAAAAAIAVGPNGASNPAFSVDATVGALVAGLKITGATTGGTVALVTTDSGSNTNLTINAKGSGTIGIGTVSTGLVTITPAASFGSTVTVATGYQIAGAATSGNYLRGNGTNFVSAAIAAGDLPLCSSSAFGACKVDGTTITASAGVITTASTTIAGTSVAPGGSITATTILDSIGSTQGMVLYRNATTWVALSPGTNGQLLTSGGAAANVSWTTATGTGSVTSITPGNGLVSSLTASCSQSAITAAGTLSAAECVNAQTGTSYTIVDGDRAKLVTASNSAAQAYSIAQAGAASAFQAGWFVDIQNLSTNVAGIATITPTTSTINGASTYKLYPGQAGRIVSDGTNYQVIQYGIPYVQSIAWTPSDGSGAGLTFTGVSAKYTQIGNMVFAYAQLTYPATGNGANAIIAGLPVTVPNTNEAQQCSQTYGGALSFFVPTKNTTTISLYNTAGGTNLTNTNLSGTTQIFLCIYPAS